MTVTDAPPPIVPGPLYPHTIIPAAVNDASPPPRVDVDGLCDLFDRSSSAVLYINSTLSASDAQLLLTSHQLVAEFDSVRGVDGIRHATDDEIAAASTGA